MREILSRGGKFAEGSFYSCLFNGYAQGLPLKQIQADCETKLGLDDRKGFGPSGRDIAGSFGKNSTYFDPASVSGSCSSGDPKRASGPDGSGNIQKNYMDGKQMNWGKYTWGGSGEYRGLSEEQSQAEKVQAIKDADEAIADWQDKAEEAKNDKDNAEKQAAADAAKKAAMDAASKALEDPNKKKPGSGASPNVASSGGTSSGGTPSAGSATRPAGDGASPCEEALQAAREILGECQRTGWRSGDCQSLWAKMHGCADPALILVDPESGYSCGDKVDPEAVKDAWIARCQQLHRPVPGGADPCAPPDVDKSGLYIRGDAPEDMCNSPIALIDPDGPLCQATVTTGKRFGETNVQDLLVWALNHFGGPIVVLPNSGPKPPPGNGPDPRPGPTP